MSPVSRNRKPKRHSQPLRPAPASPFAPILDEAKALVEPEVTVTEAELFGSFVVGGLFETSWEEAEDDDEIDPDAVFEDLYQELIDYLAKQRKRPEAQAALRALAMVGEQWTREEARAAAEESAAGGAKEPGWLKQAEEVEFTSVFRAGDLFGDVGTYNLGFRRGTEDHTVSCYVSDRGGPVLERVLVVPGNAAELAERMRADEDGALHVTEPTGAQARELLVEAIDRLLEDGPDDPEDLAELAAEAGLDPEELEMTSPSGLWALLAARLELLPEPEETEPRVGSAQDVHSTVVAFLESAQAAMLSDRDFAGALATVFADVAAVSDRTAVGFGPVSLGNFLLDEFIEIIELSKAEAEQLPAVLAAWAAFTTEQRGLGEEGHGVWRKNLPELIKAFNEIYFDPEFVEARREYEADSVRNYQVVAGTDLSEQLQGMLGETGELDAEELEFEDLDEEREDEEGEE